MEVADVRRAAPSERTGRLVPQDRFGHEDQLESRFTGTIGPVDVFEDQEESLIEQPDLSNRGTASEDRAATNVVYVDDSVELALRVLHALADMNEARLGLLPFT